MTAAPPLTATCRYCGAQIAWDDLYGWLLPTRHPCPDTWDCSVQDIHHTGHHEPKEER